MSEAADIRTAELTFFGAVCRTISHEMNNVTAILVELVGLVQDRIAASGGAPLDTERTAATMERMTAQLDRARRLMTLLNGFGHSVDSFDAEFDSSQVCRETVDLCQRFADMKRCGLEYQDDGGGVEMRGSRFMGLHILFRLIRSVLDGAEAGATIILSAAADGGGCRFRIDGAQPAENEDRRLYELLVHVAGGKTLDGAAGFWLPSTVTAVTDATGSQGGSNGGTDGR